MRFQSVLRLCFVNTGRGYVCCKYYLRGRIHAVMRHLVLDRDSHTNMDMDFGLSSPF